MNPGLQPGTKLAEPSPRPVPGGILVRWRLRAYGLAVACLFAAFLAWGFHAGKWVLDPAGRPILTDFTPMWVAGGEALSGHAATAYDPESFKRALDRVAGKRPGFYPWPYPPIYFLPAVAVGSLPYAWAFILWQGILLVACLWVVHRIAGDSTAAILVLASPLTAYNWMLGQNGLLTGSLIGASLLTLERWPLLGGGAVACLVYKPQFAAPLVLLLAVSRRWRALTGAAAGSVLLGAATWLAFGTQPWLAFPAALARRADSALIGHALPWGLFQSVYGLARFLGADSVPAGIAHGVVAVAVASATAWLWLRPFRHDLKAAAAATAALLMTPYLFAYDLGAIVIPAVFFARDAIERGWLRGERAAAGLFFIGLLAIFFTHGRAPLGAPLALALFGLILRRAIVAEMAGRQPHSG